MKLIKELTQRQVIDWQNDIAAHKPPYYSSNDNMPTAVYYDAALRAAIRTGWFSDIGDVKVALSEVDKMKPKIAQKWGVDVLAFYSSHFNDDETQKK